MNKNFKEREFEQVEGGYYDNNFYITPNGSNKTITLGFWDADGYYFNREGFDKYGTQKFNLGGYYDDNNEYVPGESWDEEHQCYKSQLGDECYDEEGEYDEYEECDDDYNKFRKFYEDDNLDDELYIDENIEKIMIYKDDKSSEKRFANKSDKQYFNDKAKIKKDDTPIDDKKEGEENKTVKKKSPLSGLFGDDKKTNKVSEPKNKEPSLTKKEDNKIDKTIQNQQTPVNKTDDNELLKVTNDMKKLNVGDIQTNQGGGKNKQQYSNNQINLDNLSNKELVETNDFYSNNQQQYYQNQQHMNINQRGDFRGQHQGYNRGYNQNYNNLGYNNQGFEQQGYGNHKPQYINQGYGNPYQQEYNQAYGFSNQQQGYLQNPEKQQFNANQKQHFNKFSQQQEQYYMHPNSNTYDFNGLTQEQQYMLMNQFMLMNNNNPQMNNINMNYNPMSFPFQQQGGFENNTGNKNNNK
jgi:hypothetical protein